MQLYVLGDLRYAPGIPSLLSCEHPCLHAVLVGSHCILLCVLIQSKCWNVLDMRIKTLSRVSNMLSCARVELHLSVHAHSLLRVHIHASYN